MTLPEKDYSKLGSLETAKKYQKIGHQLHLLSLILTGCALGVLAFSPLGALLRGWVIGFTNPFLQLQIYFIYFSVVFLIFDMPLSYYSGFVIEKRFDLSNHTLSSWLRDLVKKSLLSFVIASLLIQVFYFLMRFSPENWWWITWIFYLGFSLLLSKILPLWIIPLFYKYGPIESETLKERIQKIAIRYNLQVQNFFSLNLSRTTKKANAMFTGLGKTKRVVLADTLLKEFTEDEIEVVVAHEIGHCKHRHIIQGVVISSLFSFFLFYLAYRYLGFQSQITGLGIADPIFFPSLALGAWLISTLTGPIFMWNSRRNESQADTFALEATQNQRAFISAFEKLAAQNLADPNPNPWIERLLYSHPSIGKRIQLAKDFKFST